MLPTSHRAGRPRGFPFSQLLLVALLGLLLHSTTHAKEPSPIGEDEGRPHLRWQDARRVVGQVAFISGKIVRVGHTARVHFLDFSRDDRSAFTVVIFTEALERNFDRPLEELYENKLVEVRGTVSLYAGNPQIVVREPSQIRVVDELPPVVLPRDPRLPASGHLRVASFNVLNLFDDADDPYRNDETTPAKPRAELEHLAGVMRAVNADVLALQEVENRGYLQRFLDVLVSDLGYRHVVHFEGNDNRGIDVCLVSRIPVGPVTSHRHRTFPGPGGTIQRFQRDVLQVTLLPESGSPFDVWVVHLKSNSGGRAAAEPIRLAEARMLRQMVEDRLTKSPDSAFIICGDFNDTFESETVQTIVGTAGTQHTLLQCFANEIPAEAQITYNKEPYRDMIDFLLCSPAMARRYHPGTYRIQQGTTDTNGSDHNPVYADFSNQEENVP